MSDHVAGARWVRAALQVNPYAYKGKNEPARSFAGEDEYNEALLDQCDRHEIRMIAVTDHWSVETAGGLIAAAEERGIVALPGFEANSSEGVHILVIFDVGTSVAEINAAIGICGATPGDSGTGKCGYNEVIEKMAKRKALVIPAHVNSSTTGLLARMSGEPLEKMILHPDLHAIAISPDLPDATNQAKIIANQKPFERKHPLASIYADDVTTPSSLGNAGASCWFKVSSDRLESLKHAVRTPQTRVRLQNPLSSPRVLLREITWTGGFLDQVTIPLAEDLTTLIGGRGTGKSTVIESLRFVLSIEPIGKEALADHKAIVMDVLKSGTIVQLQLETATPTPQRFTIERVVNELPVVKDASGTATSLRPEDVLPQIEIFSQHELAEVAHDPARVAVMLQRFTGADGPDEVHLAALNALRDNRDQLAKAEKAKAVLEDELAAIPRLEEQVLHYSSTDVPKKLAAQQRLARDEAVFEEAASRVRDARNAVEAMTDAQLGSDLNAEYEAVEDSPQKVHLARAAAATVDLAKRLTDLASDLRIAIAAAETAVSAAKGDWDTAVAGQRDEYNEVLRLLHEQGLEPDKYVSTKRNLETLKAKEPRRKQMDKAMAKLLKERTGLLAVLQTHERRLTEQLHDAARAADKATAGVVIVQPVSASERDHIKTVISRHVTGQRSNIMAAVDADDFATRPFVAAARKGAGAVTKEYGIKGAQALAIITAGEELFRELEELAVGLAVDVKLDVGYGTPKREYRSMSQLSKGQKATALLLLLLSGSHAPLIIDQPEDDLDNRFVYDGIVMNLRNLKGQRQVVASTHNANVPVLGDAELIVTLEGDGQHGWPAKDGVGSLDDKRIRSYAENILEGGPDAFNARQHLYGF